MTDTDLLDLFERVYAGMLVDIRERSAFSGRRLWIASWSSLLQQDRLPGPPAHRCPRASRYPVGAEPCRRFLWAMTALPSARGLAPYSRGEDTGSTKVRNPKIIGRFPRVDPHSHVAWPADA